MLSIKVLHPSLDFLYFYGDNFLSQYHAAVSKRTQFCLPFIDQQLRFKFN